MEPAGPIETAHLFAPLHAELVRLLRGLRPEDWERPTVAGRYALPVAFRGIEAAPGSSVVVEIAGEAGGIWSLRREADAWRLWRGDAGAAVLRARMDADAAWRLFFNALTPGEARGRISVEGDPVLAEKLLTARGVVV